MKYSNNKFHNFLVMFLLVALCSLLVWQETQAQIWRVWLKVASQQIYGPKNIRNTNWDDSAVPIPDIPGLWPLHIQIGLPQ